LPSWSIATAPLDQTVSVYPYGAALAATEERRF